MPRSPLAAVLRHIHALAERAPGTTPPDRRLLERFIHQRDEAAFALLVRRHGGLVMSVAYRILHDAHAAEDIFQSTFLTLARRAASIRKREALASWLYGVAARLASQVRVQEARRQKRERDAVSPRSEDVTEAAAWRELRAVLDEELQRLPEKYRTPLVLIYFAGQTQEAAARQLAWSLGTLRRRLERGKRLLHDRLLRRGVSLSVGLLATAIAQSAASAALPLGLVERTVQEAVRFAAAQEARWLIGTLLLTRAKIALAVGVLLATGAGLAMLPGRARQPVEEKPQESAAPPAEEAKQPRVDRFGDPQPDGVLARLGTMRFRHARVTTLAFALDGKALLSCGADHKLRTWDLATGRLLREQRLPTEPTTPAFILSPDGRLLAYQDATEDSFCLWDIPRNQMRRLPWLLKNEGWDSGAFSPDSKFFVASSGLGSLRAWDVATGKGRSLGKNDNSILSFTADNKLLMTQRSRGGIDFWDLAAGRQRTHLVFSNRFLGADVSPDGRTVAVWDHWNPDQDQGLRFWDAATGKPAKGWIPPRLKQIHTARFAPDGKTVVIAQENEILVWNPIAGKAIRSLPGKANANLTFSPDGKTVAGLVGFGPFFDPHGFMLAVWNLETGTPHAATTMESGHLGEVNCVAIAPDGRTIASACQEDGSVRLWDAATGRLLRLLRFQDKLSLQNQVLMFSPDGKSLLAGASSTVIRWEVISGREVGHYPLFEAGKEDPQHLLLLQLTDDGRTLLSVSQNLGPRRNPAGGGFGYSSGIYGMQAWDVKTGKRLRSLTYAPKEDHMIAYGRFSPDGRWLAVPGGNILDAATGKQVFQLSANTKKQLDMPVAFSADGSLIASAVTDKASRGEYKGKDMVAVQVWETATLLPVVRLESGEAAHLAFTPDGRRLITAGLDALKLWDLASGRVVARRPAPSLFRGSYGPSFASCLALAPDGRTVATGQHDTVILLWDLAPPKVERPPLPLTAAQRETSWNDLAAADAGRAFTAIVRLADTPAETVAMLRRRLHPAQAPSKEELRKLLDELDNEQFERREASAGRLRELGELAASALREALQRKPSLEVRRRIESLLAEPPTVQVPEKRRQLRAVRILETVATTEARQVLALLAEGSSESHLTQHAKAALRRLARRP